MDQGQCGGNQRSQSLNLNWFWSPWSQSQRYIPSNIHYMFSAVWNKDLLGCFGVKVTKLFTKRGKRERQLQLVNWSSHKPRFGVLVSFFCMAVLCTSSGQGKVTVTLIYIVKLRGRTRYSASNISASVLKQQSQHIKPTYALPPYHPSS